MSIVLLFQVYCCIVLSVLFYCFRSIVLLWLKYYKPFWAFEEKKFVPVPTLGDAEPNEKPFPGLESVARVI